MPPRPIIHIGLHKTATTWFQRRYYPALTSHRYIDGRRVREVLLAGSAFDFDAAAARSALRFDEDGPPPVLCEEDLSGILHNGGIATGFLARAIGRRLYAVAPEAQIIIFVREQVAMTAACYNQYVREGGTFGVHRYLFPADYRHLGNARPFKVPRFDFSQFDAAGLIEHYDALFGQANVHVFAYEAFARDPAAFITEYERRLGLSGTAAPGGGTVNGSFRRGLLPIARAFNHLTVRGVADKRVLLHVPGWYWLRKQILRGLNRWPVFGSTFPPEQLLGTRTAAWIRARFAPMNRRLAARMGCDLRSLGYTIECCEAPRPAASSVRRLLRN